MKRTRSCFFGKANKINALQVNVWGWGEEKTKINLEINKKEN